MVATLNGPNGRTALGPTSLSLGRAPDNQLVVNDPKSSSHHAEIRPEGSGYSIIDLGSTNGTFINEQRIQANVPHLLAAGDMVRIGDTIFTYELTGVSEIEPTAYAAPPFVGYGSDAQQGAPQAYQPPPPPPAYQAYPYAPPAQQYAPQYAPQPMSPPGMPGYAAPVPVARPKSRRGLWIALGIIGGVLLIGIVLFAVIAANVSTPTKTLNAFCSALKSGDYQTAYNQLTSSLQSQLGTEAVFAAAFSSNGQLGKITDCTVSNVNDSAGTGTITYTFAGGRTLVDDYVLIQENNTWKINAQNPRT